MELKVNPQMVTLARESRGLSQVELAERSGLSQATISKVEGGIIDASEDVAIKLASAVDYPHSFLTQREELYGIDTSVLYHRKRESLPAKLLHKTHAMVNVYRIHVTRLLRSAAINPVKKFPQYDLAEFDGDVERVSRAVRATWMMSPGPVPNVTKAIEDAGGIVISVNFGTRLLDAIHQWIPGLPPLFFVNKDVPGDRLRFSLAHELGHAVMHRTASPEMEDEANLFADCFLMPSADIGSSLAPVSLARLAVLKPYWKVSMQALLMRASQLGKISEHHKRIMWAQFSKAGYRLSEPSEVAIPREEPRLLDEVLNLHINNLKYSLQDLARILCIHEPEMVELYHLGRPLRLVRARFAM